MLVCMRTTMNLPDGLLEQVKARAQASGRTTTSMVEEALRLLLAQATPAAPRRPMPTYGTPGGRVLVDLSDNEAVRDAMDEAADRAMGGARDPA